MATTQVVDESLLDSLRDLRAEEQALMGLLTRADGNSNALVLRDHRRRLGRIRQRIEERLPEAFHMCSHCMDEAQRLRRTIQGLRRQLQALRQQAQQCDNDDDAQSNAQTALQHEYNRVYGLLERHEYYLSVLDEFLPGLSEKLGGPRPKPPPPVMTYTVPAPTPVSIAPQPPHPVHTPEPVPGAVTSIPPVFNKAAAPPAGDAAPVARQKVFQADRRAHKRVPLAAPVRFRLDGRSMVARSVDVSMGGMFIETGEPLPAGTEISVLFCGAEGFPIELPARIMYEMQGTGVGVKFLDMPETDRKYLEALINEIDQKQ